MKKNVRASLISLVSILMLVSCNDDITGREPYDNEIKDASGRIVAIPDNNINVTVASVYAVANPFYVALNIDDRVKACNNSKPFVKNNSNLRNASNVGNGVVDLEKLASLNPTCFVHRSNDPKTVKKVKKLGIDVITITVENVDDVKYTLNNLGKYFGVSDRASEVIEFIDNQFSYIDSIVSTIPEDRKVTALSLGGELGRVAGSDMLQSWMIQKAGGKIVVDTYSNHNWINVGEEKVLQYNPDYIFATSSTARNYTIEGLLNDNAYQAVKAIKNNHVYVVPALYDSWDIPGLSIHLGTLFMLRTMYPEYLSMDEFIDKIDEYYLFMYGRTYSSEVLGYELN